MSFAHTTRAGDTVLLASGSGRAETYGWAETNVTAPLRVGQSYCLRAELGYEGLVDLQRHTRIELNGPGYLSGLFEYDRPCAGALSAQAAASCRSGSNWVVGQKRFTYGWPSPMSSSNGTGTVRLYLKYTPHGRVWWRKVSLTECEPAPKRPPVRPRVHPTPTAAAQTPTYRLWSLRQVKIAAAWWSLSGDGFWPNGSAVNYLPYWERWLDSVGAEGVDLALVPEGFNGCGGKRTFECVQPLMGPSGQLLQRMAKKWDMHVVGTFYAWGTEPNSSDLAYNSGAEPFRFASHSMRPKRSQAERVRGPQRRSSAATARCSESTTRTCSTIPRRTTASRPDATAYPSSTSTVSVSS